MKKLILFAVAALMTMSVYAQAPKFAYVNIVELVQLTPEADAARTQLQAATKEAQDTYQSMMQEYQNKYQQYQTKVNSWTPAVKESKEKELMDLTTRIQQFENSVKQDMAQQEAKLMAPIQKKAMEVVNKLAKEGNYTFVFDKNTMLYVDNSQVKDLTPEARKILKIKPERTLESLQSELQAQQNQAQPVKK